MHPGSVLLDESLWDNSLCINGHLLACLPVSFPTPSVKALRDIGGSPVFVANILEYTTELRGNVSKIDQKRSRSPGLGLLRPLGPLGVQASLFPGAGCDESLSDWMNAPRQVKPEFTRRHFPSIPIMARRGLSH